MNNTAKQAMNDALDALNANSTNTDRSKAEYLDQFRTRADVLQFAREGTGLDPETATQAELDEEAEWVDDAWEAVEKYIESRDA